MSAAQDALMAKAGTCQVIASDVGAYLEQRAELASVRARVTELESVVTRLEDTVANVIRVACAASNEAERDLREAGLL